MLIFFLKISDPSKAEVKVNRKRCLSDSSIFQNSKLSNDSKLSKFGDSNDTRDISTVEDPKVPKSTSSSAPNSPLRTGNELSLKVHFTYKLQASE